MKFYPVWSRGCQETASDGQTDRQTEDAAPTCSPFGEHNNDKVYKVYSELLNFTLILPSESNVYFKFPFCLKRK